MTERCYFNKGLICSRSIDRQAKELTVHFQNAPEIQEYYEKVVIDEFQEPNHISVSYDAAEASKVFRRWKREYFHEVKLLIKTEAPSGLYVKFSYKEMHDH